MQELILQVKLFCGVNCSETPCYFAKKKSIIELVDLCEYFSKKEKL